MAIIFLFESHQHLIAEIKVQFLTGQYIRADRFGYVTPPRKQTTPLQLELQSSSSGVVITRKIPIGNIQRIWVDGKWLSPAELPAKYPAVQQADFNLELNKQTDITISVVSEPSRNPVTANVLPPQPAERTDELHLPLPARADDPGWEPAFVHVPDIYRVAITAEPTNRWGRADWDALQVQIVALDRIGQIVPFRGTARIKLWGSEQRIGRGFGPHLNTQNTRIKSIADWTRFIETDPILPAALSGMEVRPVGLELLLPRPYAEHDMRISPYGQLQLELSVPGQGVYHASSDLIPMVKRNLLRDQLLLETGSRFYNREATSGRIDRSSIGLRNFTSIRPSSRIFTIQP